MAHATTDVLPVAEPDVEIPVGQLVQPVAPEEDEKAPAGH
jgi:hypothetical protein